MNQKFLDANQQSERNREKSEVSMTLDRDRSSAKRIRIVFHILENLDEQNRQRVQYYLMQASGVEHAHFDKFRQQLLIVEYTPSRTDSSTILDRIAQQQLHARLIVGI